MDRHGKNEKKIEKLFNQVLNVSNHSKEILLKLDF